MAGVHRNREAASAPLVVALDVGSSAVRVVAFDAGGRTVAAAHTPYAMDTTPDGGVETDADRLCDLAAETLDQLLSSLGTRGPVAAVATSTFWHTVLGVGPDGRARTPLYSWADTRSAPQVRELRRRLDEAAYHGRTGCPLHTSYLPARLLWLRARDPDAFRGSARFLSFGEYLHLRWLGETRCTVSMASASGLYDHAREDWDPVTLEALDLEPARLGPLGDLSPPLGCLRETLAARWPALRGVPWFPALGDGACSNVGCGAVTPGRAALMVGTSGALRVCVPGDRGPVPPGLWRYRIDRRRALLGGALANGGSVRAWLQATLRLPPPEEVEAALAAREPDGHGLTVLPFLAGERSPGWVPDARAALVGMTLAAQPLDLLQAALETVAYRFVLVHERLRPACPELTEAVTTGGALAASPAWTRILADALGLVLHPSLEPEASARGAALLALEALRRIPGVEAVPAATGPPVIPDPARQARYRAGLARHRRLYAALMPFFTGGPLDDRA